MSTGLNKETLTGYIWSQRQHLHGYMVWRVISVLAITPFPVLSQKIVDVAIPGRDMAAVRVYTSICLALLCLHFVSMRLGVGNLSRESQEIFSNLRGCIFHKGTSGNLPLTVESLISNLYSV